MEQNAFLRYKTICVRSVLRNAACENFKKKCSLVSLENLSPNSAEYK